MTQTAQAGYDGLTDGDVVTGESCLYGEINDLLDKVDYSLLARYIQHNCPSPKSFDDGYTMYEMRVFVYRYLIDTKVILDNRRHVRLDGGATHLYDALLHLLVNNCYMRLSKLDLGYGVVWLFCVVPRRSWPKFGRGSVTGKRIN